MRMITALEHFDVHSTNKSIRIQDNVRSYAMGVLGACQDVLWLLQDTHNPLGLDGTSGTRHKRRRAIIEHALFSDVSIDALRHFSAIRLPRSLAT
jgi:hypothetical protein